MSIDYKIVGSRIKTKRKERGLTQERLAELLDVSVGYVSQLERGVTKVSLDTLAAIGVLLECDLPYFVAQSGVLGNEYRCDEFTEKFCKLNSKNRAIIIDVMDVLLKNQ